MIAFLVFYYTTGLFEIFDKLLKLFRPGPPLFKGS